MRAFYHGRRAMRGREQWTEHDGFAAGFAVGGLNKIGLVNAENVFARSKGLHGETIFEREHRARLVLSILFSPRIPFLRKCLLLPRTRPCKCGRKILYNCGPK